MEKNFCYNGVLNSILGMFGLDTQFAWLGNTKTAIWTLVLLAIWQFGSSMLIFLSALKQIPRDLYEAADVDGANKFVKFFKITLPLLTPTIFFNLVMQMINGFLAFTQSLIITMESLWTVPCFMQFICIDRRSLSIMRDMHLQWRGLCCYL